MTEAVAARGEHHGGWHVARDIHGVMPGAAYDPLRAVAPGGGRLLNERDAGRVERLGRDAEFFHNVQRHAAIARDKPGFPWELRSQAGDLGLFRMAEFDREPHCAGYDVGAVGLDK